MWSVLACSSESVKPVVSLPDREKEREKVLEFKLKDVHPEEGGNRMDIFAMSLDDFNDLKISHLVLFFHMVDDDYVV